MNMEQDEGESAEDVCLLCGVLKFACPVTGNYTNTESQFCTPHHPVQMFSMMRKLL